MTSAGTVRSVCVLVKQQLSKPFHCMNVGFLIDTIFFFNGTLFFLNDGRFSFKNTERSALDLSPFSLNGDILKGHKTVSQLGC